MPYWSLVIILETLSEDSPQASLKGTLPKASDLALLQNYMGLDVHLTHSQRKLHLTSSPVQLLETSESN